MDIDLKDAQALIHKSQIDPVWWIETFLDCKLWKKQREILSSLVTERRIAVASGHELGKSFISGAGALWFLFTHPNSKVITTANTFVQVRTVIWTEIRTQHKKLEERFSYAGEIFLTELRLDTDWWAIGLSSDNPDAFQGRHAEHLLIIVDEACGISYETFYAIEGSAASPGNRVLLIGNPTDPNTYFGHTFSGKVPGWMKMSMSCYESPNIYLGSDGKYHNYDPLPYPFLVEMEWINEKKRQWGINNPQYIARVLGQFPEQSEDQLISGRYISAAAMRGMILRQHLKELEEGSQIISSQHLRQLYKEN